MKPLTAEEIAELRRVIAAAPPLPYKAGEVNCCEINPDKPEPMSVLLASAANALPRLLDEVERSRNELAFKQATDASALNAWTECDGLKAWQERSRALLKRIQWAGGLGQNSYGCAVCEYEERQRHAPGCELAALIGGTT
jgi:hypothetical protein